MGPPGSGGRRGPPFQKWMWKRTPLEVDTEEDPPEVDVEEDPLEVEVEEDPLWKWRAEEDPPPKVVVEEDQLSTAGQVGDIPEKKGFLV